MSEWNEKEDWEYEMDSLHYLLFKESNVLIIEATSYYYKWLSQKGMRQKSRGKSKWYKKKGNFHQI